MVVYLACLDNRESLEGKEIMVSQDKRARVDYLGLPEPRATLDQQAWPGPRENLVKLAGLAFPAQKDKQVCLALGGLEFQEKRVTAVNRVHRVYPVSTASKEMLAIQDSQVNVDKMARRERTVCRELQA